MPATSTPGITCSVAAAGSGSRISAPPGVSPSRSVVWTCIASGAPSTATCTPTASSPCTTDSSSTRSSAPGATTTWLRPAIAAGPSAVETCTDAVAGRSEGLDRTSTELSPEPVETPRKEASVVGSAQRVEARERKSPLRVMVDWTTSATGRPPSEVSAVTVGAVRTSRRLCTLTPRSCAAGSPSSVSPSASSAVIEGARTAP